MNYYIFGSFFVSFVASIRIEPPTETFELMMPNAKPTMPETYLCTPVVLDEDNTYYIVGFEPNGEMETVHHMLLYGCEEPGVSEAFYNCGDMATNNYKGVKTSRPCKKGSTILYAWAKNAPKLDLPPDVGFKVGGPKSKIKYLVLQIHYASVDKIPPEGDTSGVVLRYTDVPQPKAAGVYFSSTSGVIPGGSTTYMEAACKLTENKVIHPFAFRTHTHALGRVVSGYKVASGPGGMKWTLVGKKDPQLPQMFYPVEDTSVTLQRGDTFASRCTMVSYRNRMTWVGSTAEDEMCNFYMMYWVDGEEKLKNEKCHTAGPPIYSWGGWIMGGGLTNIPDKDASSLV